MIGRRSPGIIVFSITIHMTIKGSSHKQYATQSQRVKTLSTLHIMTSKQPPPALEDAKSPEDKCSECQNDNLKFCLTCLRRITNNDIKAMVEKIIGRQLYYAPTFKVTNDRLVPAPSETSEDTFPPSDDGDHSGCDGPASPDPTPNSPEVSEVMSVNVSDENVGETSEEKKNNDSNFGNMSHIITLSEKLTPTIFDKCANCEDFHAPICETAHAKSILDWIEGATKYAAENETEYKMKKLFEAFKLKKNAPLEKIDDNINDIDDSISDIDE